MLDLPSKLSTVESIDGIIAGLARSAGCDEEGVQDVAIAVHEAVINAIVHGNHQDASKRVRVRATATPADLEFVIEDEGQGFDAHLVPDPTGPENLSKPSGRGIFFMRLLMDEVIFRHGAAGGTEVLLHKRIRGAFKPNAFAFPIEYINPKR